MDKCSGGEAFIFSASNNNNLWENGTVEIQTIKTGQRKTLITGGYFGRYIAASDVAGYLLYVHEGTVFAAPMDLKKMELKGTASPVLEDISGHAQNGFSQFDVASNGTLIYVPGSNTRNPYSLGLLDVTGKVQVFPTPPAGYGSDRDTGLTMN